MKTLAAIALLALPLAAPAADGHRFALVVGEPDGGAGTHKLRYAERDARRIYAILTRLGGVAPDDAKLLVEPDAGDLRDALKELEARAAEARAHGERTLLVFYYSGHSKDGELRLGSSRWPLDELRKELEAAPADVRIGLVDSCQSGAITRAKGVRLAPRFDVKQAAASAPRGLVLIASSAADEASQESDELGASFFTHYLASGLLGDADASGDGKVTLAEAYAYAYGRTVGSTAGTAAGAQHPEYLYDLGGAGDVVLTDLAPAKGALDFPAASEGVYVVLDAGHRAIAEVAKVGGAPRRLALAPGRYTVKKRLPYETHGLLVGDFTVGGADVPVDDARLQLVPVEKDPQKGFGGAQWSATLGFGGERFFDAAARAGYFPPAGLGGLELGVRDDLGHDLAWGLDLAVGGGASTLTLPGVDPLGVKFREATGGASLWRDFGLGPVTLSVGARVAFLYLGRSFDAKGLPDQYFFTMTPGLVGAASWRVSTGFSLVARGRVNYLFYDVDKDMSLGFFEWLAGVEYAFGD